MLSPVSTNRPFEVKTAIRENLEIKDIEEPEDGKTPDTTASVSYSNCFVKNLKWYAGKKLFKGSTFKEGVTYTVQVQIKPKKGYYEVFRTSKKSGSYGSKPYYKTTDGSKASYKNSRNLKKGTRYYYKVRDVKKADNRIVYTK